MERRLKLHQMLVDALGSDNVYFEPPENIKIKYPCIIYYLDGIDSLYADNKPYLCFDRYYVVCISKTQDNCLKDRVKLLPKCRFDRSYFSDNLFHAAFTISY